MTEIFADTSFFIALLDSSDAYHQRAKRLGQRLRGRRLVTTSAVVLELGGHFHMAAQHKLLFDAIRVIQSPDSVMVHVDEALLQRGLALFAERQDKDWSLADCVSIVVMNDRNLQEAASTDRHFEQAGFVPLLRVDAESN